MEFACTNVQRSQQVSINRLLVMPAGLCVGVFVHACLCRYIRLCTCIVNLIFTCIHTHTQTRTVMILEPTPGMATQDVFEYNIQIGEEISFTFAGRSTGGFTNVLLDTAKTGLGYDPLTWKRETTWFPQIAVTCPSYMCTRLIS